MALGIYWTQCDAYAVSEVVTQDTTTRMKNETIQKYRIIYYYIRVRVSYWAYKYIRTIE